MKIIGCLLAVLATFSVRVNARIDQLPTMMVETGYTFNAEIQGERVALFFWRDTLISGQSIPFMRVEPSENSLFFICSTSFFVVQEGKQFESLTLISTDESKLCYSFKAEKTFVFDQKNANNKFDVKKAFTIVYDSGSNTHYFDIPAANEVDQQLDSPVIINPTVNQASKSRKNYWADLEYEGVDEIGNHVWKLVHYGMSQ